MKRSISRLLSILLAPCVVLTLLSTTAWAAETSGSCGDNVTWSYSDGILTFQGTGNMYDDYYSMMDLPPWFDYWAQIHTVKIADGVTNIESYAIAYCNLTNAVIGKSVANIEGGAFSGCTTLMSIDVASDNPVYSSVDGVLFNADQTVLLTYPAGKSDQTYNIPASVTSIGANAFYACDELTNITIPNSVTSIGYAAFEGCSGLTNVIIPDSVTTIEAEAFRFCGWLNSVTLPDSVTTIGSHAFYNCSSLTSATIPNNITAIKLGTFEGCTDLTSVTIPGSVTTIADQAFWICHSLTDVYYGGSEAQWKQIEISEKYNDPLFAATIHYTAASPVSEDNVPQGGDSTADNNNVIDSGDAIRDNDNGAYVNNFEGGNVVTAGDSSEFPVIPIVVSVVVVAAIAVVLVRKKK